MSRNGGGETGAGSELVGSLAELYPLSGGFRNLRDTICKEAVCVGDGFGLLLARTG